MAKEGDHESLKMMLQFENLDLSLTFPQNGNTALHESISRSRNECSKLLIEYMQGRADQLTTNFINHQNSTGNSLLMLSALKGDIYSLAFLSSLFRFAR